MIRMVKMVELRVGIFLGWLVVGLLTLITKKRVSKAEYLCVWVPLMVVLFERIIK